MINEIKIYKDNLINLLDIKKNNLKNILVIQDDLDMCKSNLKDNYLNLKEKIEEFTKENIKELENRLKEEISESFKLRRLKEFLNKYDFIFRYRNHGFIPWANLPNFIYNG